MTRRGFFLGSVAASLIAAEDPEGQLRGKLVTGQRSRLRLRSGETVELTGDRQTSLVLADHRLEGSELELLGTREGANTFRVGPIHTKSMFVVRDGKRLFVTYWCEVCSIRTYAPGKCHCCQDETALDLRETLNP